MTLCWYLRGVTIPISSAGSPYCRIWGLREYCSDTIQPQPGQPSTMSVSYDWKEGVWVGAVGELWGGRWGVWKEGGRGRREVGEGGR